jgi:FdhE protein
MTHEEWRAEWLGTHAFLEPVARLLDRVECAVSAIDCPAAALPRWDDYAADYGIGVPLLRSADAGPDLLPAGAMTGALVGELANGPASDRVAADARALRGDVDGGAGSAQRVVDWLLEFAPTAGNGAFRPARPGLLRFLGWTAMRRYLLPVLDAFARWRDEDRWLRSHCPACGALPAMAQLIGVDPGRKRFLACGSCGTRWRYRRTACPFCDGDSHRVAVVTVEGEAGLRIDHCEACGAYLKTYEGLGREALLLADWTSLHLDVLAQDRGLKRMAASLYGLEPASENH